MLPTWKIIIVIPNPLIPHVREIIARSIFTPIILLIGEMTNMIIPSVIIPHARKTSIITQHKKITTTIIMVIAILSHVGKITFTIVP